MRLVRSFVAIALLASPAVHAQSSKTYTGIITDTMCGLDHTVMKVSPDSKCVTECVKTGHGYKYALADGKNIYTLSDQETPETFAGQKVKVTGVLYEKTKILKVERIEKAN